MKVKWIVVAVSVAIGLTSLAQEPVALVNGDPITREELDGYTNLNYILYTLYTQHTRFAMSLLSTPEGQAFLERYERDSLEELILRKIQLQEAEALGLVADEAAISAKVDEYINWIKSYYGLTDEGLVQELEASGMTLEEYREDLAAQAREQVLLAALKQEITKNVAVTEEEIAQYYADNPDQFKNEAGEPMTLEEARDKIYTKLLSEKRDTAWQEWLSQARASAEVEIRL